MNKLQELSSGWTKERCEKAEARKKAEIYDALNELTVEILNAQSKRSIRKSQKKRLEKLARRARED